MTALFRIAIHLVQADRRAMLRGAVLSVAVLGMGAALLGLSGWFITATGLAGLAGIGIAFDVFRPSAGVRFLALGRAAARYGERLLTHDATLRALAALRVALLRGVAKGDAKALAGLRGEGALTRIISDVDALDGLILRLILPAAAALVTHILTFAALVWLLGWPLASVLLAGYVPVAVLVLTRLARAGLGPSARAEEDGQALRRGVIDMIRDREALILAATLEDRETRLASLDESQRNAARRLDRADRDAGFLLSGLVAAVAMAAFLVGASLLEQGKLGPAQAVIGFFVALALAETLLPLRRGVSDLGRMVGAAGRVALQSGAACPAGPGPDRREHALLIVDRPGLALSLAPGQAVAITGPSGVGKSSLLMRIAGLDDAEGILIKGIAPTDWPDDALRGAVSVLPQRSALIAGTIRDNLSLAGSFSDEEMWSALETVVLTGDILERGGLDARLGEGGSGLSGGQARRLSLARNILKKPEILLLDEPTEGLDSATATAVLEGVRRALPTTLIVAVMHRGSDHPVFERQVELTA